MTIKEMFGINPNFTNTHFFDDETFASYFHWKGQVELIGENTIYSLREFLNLVVTSVSHTSDATLVWTTKA